MGPVLIFDKSFLESLTVNESVWLDNYFLCNITPIFYVETLADLEKSKKGGITNRSHQDIVIETARKTPVMNPCPNMHHHKILIGELLGQSVDMTHRRIIRNGGVYKQYRDGTIGVDFKEFPEEVALMRWKRGEFDMIEKDIAKEWRIALQDFNYDEVINYINLNLSSLLTPTVSLQEVKILVDKLVESKYKQFINFAIQMLGVPETFHKKIVERWKNNNWQSFKDFAPYSAHVLTVDLFFFIGLSRGLIGKERASSNKIDISYLYYLPFTHIFVSNDRLHKRVAPLFLDNDQSFVFGEDLKKDFQKISSYFAKLPNNILELGVTTFAQYPPIEVDTIVGQLHDKNLISWRENAKNFVPSLPKQDKKLIKMLKDRKNTEELYIGPRIESDAADSMLVTRKVPLKRGNWYVLPKELSRKI